MKEFMRDPMFIPQFNISVDEERALALKRLQAICSKGFFSVRDFKTVRQQLPATAASSSRWTDGGSQSAHCTLMLRALASIFRILTRSSPRTSWLAIRMEVSVTGGAEESWLHACLPPHCPIF